MKRIYLFLLALLLAICAQAAKAAPPASGSFHSADLMLPKVFSAATDVSGWLLSEKLDGVRGYWDGHRLFSKHGHLFHPPAAFSKNFPNFALEGEIWGGRGTFEQTVATVRRQKPGNDWLKLKFAIFDVPKATGGFRQRLQKAKNWFAKHQAPYAFIIPQRPVQNNDDLQNELRRVEKLGGEGLIVREADALYGAGRNADILKVKSYRDMEAVVVAHIPGAGKNKGRLGALEVRLPDGKILRIGTGFTDAERENPPPVGSTITFKYYGLYQSGLPKFASFLRLREDKGL
jgi:DNA ligase-1